MSARAGRIVELQVAMRPTAAMRLAQVKSVLEPLDMRDEREHVGGGEVSIRVILAPPMAQLPPGKWLGAVVEQWPDGHADVLGAFHADNEVEAFTKIAPLYKQIMAARGAVVGG